MSRTVQLAFAVVCILFAASQALAAGTFELTLARDGRPASSIVVAENSTRAAHLAAFELQHHVELITGARLPIVGTRAEPKGARILVGGSDVTRQLGFDNEDFEHQEYLMKFLPDTLILMGRDEQDRGNVKYDYMNDRWAASTWPGIYDEQGTMYAVYDFLEKHCGVRWINPSEVGTITPQSPDLTVRGSELRRRPFMLYRGGRAAGMFSRYQEGGGLWARGTEEAETYADAAYAKIRRKYPEDEGLYRSAVSARNQLFQHRMKAGGDKRLCNHSFYHYYERFLYKDHENFEEYHPEYFAKGYDGKPPQMCYSSQAVVDQVVTDARNYFDHGGHQKRMAMIGTPGYTWGEDYYAVAPMDAGSFCRGDECSEQYELDRDRSGHHSTYWFRFVNRVARELKKTHPDKFISTLAYGSYEGLPRDVELEDNVAVHFCVSHNRNPGTAPKQLEAQMDRLRRWREAELEVPMYLWLYHTFPTEIARNGGFKCFPGFFAHELGRQFKTFHELDVEGIFHCGFNGEVENYVSYKLMDDPTLEVDTLLDDYFSAYGDAAGAMRAFYELGESRYTAPSLIPEGDRPLNGHQNVRIAWKYQGNSEAMKKLGALMKEAREKADGKAAKLVELWEKAVWTYMREGRARYVERSQAPIPSLTAPRVPAAQGDPDQVAWETAVDVGDKWYQRGGDKPSKRTFRGRMAHDGEYFYLQLVEENVTKDQLHVSPVVHPYDTWEPVFALQRAQPFRQYSSGPTGKSKALSHGEVNWRQNVEMPETGFRVSSDTSGNRWVTRMSWPLETILNRPVEPGDTIYMNILRVSNPDLSGEPLLGIDSWVSHCTVKEVDRLGEIKLEQ